MEYINTSRFYLQFCAQKVWFVRNQFCMPCVDIFNQNYHIQKQVELIKTWRISFYIKYCLIWTLYFIEIRHVIARKGQKFSCPSKHHKVIFPKSFLFSNKFLGLQTIICKISNHPCAKKKTLFMANFVWSSFWKHIVFCKENCLYIHNILWLYWHCTQNIVEGPFNF